MKNHQFKKGFLWGCSTSAHQIEGNVTNDWSEWEQSEKRTKELLAKAKDPADFVSGIACDSWNRPEEDIDCLKQLGVNSYRFSLEWSRIEPTKGNFDNAALKQYLDFIISLKENNIVPFVTIWHWPMPLWVRDQGGWESKKTIKDFEDFTKKVVEVLGDEVEHWITINEPLVYASNSYLSGMWPPQKKSLLKTIRVARNLAFGHRVAYHAIKKVSDAQVGISSHNIHFSAKQPWGINQLIAKASTYFWNDWFLNRTRDTQDFIGLNYYFHQSIDFKFGKKEGIYSDLGWELVPEGLEHVLMDLKRFNKPVYITEHGLADKDDRHRAWYLTESLKHIHSANERGVNIQGYFHWSLLDNFEWADGYFPRFGLFEVNRKTCARTPRPSVAVYRKIIENNGV
jgi:beta-glucosidase